MRFIELLNGGNACVDDSDYTYLKQWRWSRSEYGYASRYPGRKQKKIFMHRLILGAKEGQAIDHINTDRLDNRQCNLRFATKSQNGMNSHKQRRQTTSIYKGVSWDAIANKWRAQVGTQGNRGFLGTFKRETDAAIAYDLWATLVFGEFARTNFKVEKSGP